MTVTALLPMKGHSERVPNKNMKLFAGKPLYHAIVDTLQKCPSVSCIAINTDSDYIKKDVTNNFSKVTVIDRPEAICGDFVSMNKIIAYDLSVLGEGHYLQTHSTNPLLRVETIEAAIKKYFDNLGTNDSLFSVTRMQTRLYWEDGRPVNHNPDELIRTQDLPVIYEENSNFYIFSSESFKQNGEKRIGKKPLMFTTSKLESVDIDEQEDFTLAEMLYLNRKHG